MTFGRTLLAGALAALLGAAAPVEAQYFGRHPVQWERLRFEVLKTQHFDLHYYPEGKEAAEQSGRLAERWRSRLGRILDYDLPGRQPLILYASHPHFQQTNTIGGPPGEGTGGVTESFKRRIVLPVGVSLAETDHVLGHELVHAYQYAITGQGKTGADNPANRMPLWFIEGMAEYLSVGPIDAHTSLWMRDAARGEKLPTIRELGGVRYFPYRWGQALWAYVAGRYGDRVIGNMLRRAAREGDPEIVFKEVLGIDEKTLTKDWHAAIKEALAPQFVGRKSPHTYGPALVTEKGQGGRLNVGPALSPDGARLAFLSERDLYSVELFVADIASGKVTRRLSRSVVDPHLESLQFINSAGAWDRSGASVALGAVSKGRPLLLILDAKNGDKRREIPFAELGEIHTPSFSPDGRRVVFSALKDGFTDLFICDLETGALTRLTEDSFADLQPSWSPDGKVVAFVTDRFSTDLGTLAAGNYRLATVDVASREVRALPGFATAKNINPQWAPSGRSLYFVSDGNGNSNVYRLELESGGVFQLTDLVTGASGITALSPVLSSAAVVDRLAYSVFDDGRYEIHTIDQADRLAGWPVALEEPAQAGLIPGARATGEVLEARARPEEGLADPAGFSNTKYKPKLGLDFVGQPYVGAGYSRYGTFYGGGISMRFSDMLGEHTLSAVLQVDRVSSFNDVGGAFTYINRVRRFNWGAQIAQIPYVTGAFDAGVTVIDGRQVYLERTLLERQVERGISAIGIYPFDGALRVELQAGYRGIAFDRRLTSQGFSLDTGELILDLEEDLPSQADIHLFEGTVALVRDSSVFGPTSPVLGQRFRLDVSPVRGTVNYTGVLADFRQYLMPVRPLTLAGRLLHFGRYGSGGEDLRLNSLFVGYPNLVRGYDTGSFSASECGTQGGCPVYDQLLGSRLLVANVEARMPLLSLFGVRKQYAVIPVDVGAFFDAGVAWDSATSPSLFGGEREMVKSVGATARANVLGFVVLQLDFVKPLDRPGKGAFFQFNLLAGF